MKSFIAVLFYAIILAMFTVSHAHAAHEPGTFSLTPTAGVTVFDDSADIQDSPTVGIKLDYGIMTGSAGSMSLEGLASAARLKSTTGNGSANAIQFRVGPLFSFPTAGKLTPLMTASVGGMFIGDSVNAVPEKNAFVSFGLGASYDISRRTAVRADISRLFVLDMNGSNGFELTLGVSYAFGGAERKAPPAQGAPVRTASAPVGKGKGTGTPPPAAAAPVKKEKPEAPLPAATQPKPAAPAAEATTAPASAAPPEKILALSAQPAAQGEAPAPPVEVPAAAGSGQSNRAAGPAGIPAETAVTIQFAPGMATLPPSCHDQLKRIADLVKSNPAFRIRIAGHTDNVGDPHANYLFSRKRAERVRDYFVKALGIDPRRVIAKGYGHYQPVADNGTAEGRSRNRRVVAIVLKTVNGEW